MTTRVRTGACGIGNAGRWALAGLLLVGLAGGGYAQDPLGGLLGGGKKEEPKQGEQKEEKKDGGLLAPLNAVGQVAGPSPYEVAAQQATTFMKAAQAYLESKDIDKLVALRDEANTLLKTLNTTLAAAKPDETAAKLRELIDKLGPVLANAEKALAAAPPVLANAEKALAAAPPVLANAEKTLAAAQPALAGVPELTAEATKTLKLVQTVLYLAVLAVAVLVVCAAYGTFVAKGCCKSKAPAAPAA